VAITTTLLVLTPGGPGRRIPGGDPAYLLPTQLGAVLAQESAEWAGLMKTRKVAAQ
jgi:hypothetical protein